MVKLRNFLFIQDETVKQTSLVMLILVIMGFLVFSPFSSILIMDMLGCPISLPEILFLPFLILFRKRYQFSSPGNFRTIVLLLVWLSMIGISVVAGNYSLSTILASSRTYLLIIIAFLLFSKENNVSLDDVMYISLGSTLGWLVSAIYGISSYLAGNADVISRCGNMLAIPLLIGIAIYKKNYKVLVLAIIVCIAVSVTAGMRRQIVVFIMSLFLSYVFMSLGSVKRFIKQTSALVLLVGIFLLFLPRIENYVKDNIPVLYFRIFVKTEKFLAGKMSSTGDNIRVSEMSNLTKEIKDYILPQGFVSRRTELDKTGRFIDFPLSEIFYMFGVFFAVLILAYIFFCTFSSFYYSLKGNRDGIIFVILSLIMIMLLFLEGTFLSSSYVSPFTGYCLGRLRYYSRISFSPGVKIEKRILYE